MEKKSAVAGSLESVVEGEGSNIITCKSEDF